MSERLSITPLGPYIGAQITGADLTRPLSDNQFEQLYHAVLRHQVVFLRDQAITPQQQRALAQRFGELHIHPVYPHAEGVDEIIVLDTHNDNPPDNDNWHTDVTFIKNPPLLHPVVRTHPVTGKQALFVNEGFTTRIVDVSEKESEALLGFLFAHITKPEFQVRWRWQPNDIAIWDNRVTQHYANADYLPQRRIMHRATILGDIPFYRAG